MAHVALLVRDYDEAIAWFTDKLGFTLVADERVGPELAAASPGSGCEHPGDVQTGSGPPVQPEQDKPEAISAEGGSEIATSKRWVLVAPPGAGDSAATLLLARAATPEQEAFIGNPAGGRVFLFLRTDDFARDYAAIRAKGVTFVREPATHAYGTVAVFADLYGKLWDLVQFA